MFENFYFRQTFWVVNAGCQEKTNHLFCSNTIVSDRIYLYIFFLMQGSLQQFKKIVKQKESVHIFCTNRNTQ